MKKKPDTILDLMRARWAAAEEVEAITARLMLAQRAQRDTADQLADALGKESNARLVTIMRLEHPPKKRGKKGPK
jgi:hypothetical protein